MPSTINKQDKIRESVSQSYARAVTGPQPGSCGGEPVQKGTAVKLAGYAREELDSLPADAVVNSFGCGNPVAFSGVKEGDVVLDLGSGAGIDLLIAAKRVGPSGRVIGVDMTDEMIVKARENIAKANADNVEVRKGTIEELPVESGSVDWVISNCVINLSPDKPRVFAEIARVLKPGGRMRVSDIVVQDLPDWVRESEALYSSCIAGAISQDAYLEGLRQAGLTDVAVADRVVYDTGQLKALAESELTDATRATLCCGGQTADETIGGLAESMTGKIWSALITARKPA